MVTGRNWLKTLWPASYRGAPFEVESDDEEGGRRIVSHEYPMRDDPFNEDLGARKRDFEVTAYVAADDVEGRADAVVAACSARGPALLVLPTHGSILARCLDFKRDRDKDHAGKIAFSLKFVREGAPTALISFSMLANLIVVGADGLQTAVASFASAALLHLGVPDFVIRAATDALADGAAMLEAIRVSEPIDPAVSGVQRRSIQALYDAAPSAVGSTVAGDQFAKLVGIARALGDGMTGAAAIAAFEPLIVSADVPAKAILNTANAAAADANRLATYQMIRLAALAAYSEGIAQVTIPDRSTAIALRANAAEYFDGAMSAMAAADSPLLVAAATLRDSVTNYLSRTILNRAPVVPVGSNFKMPSLWWAHRLYQDPSRSGELVERNAVSHPSFMPLEFEAIAR